MGKKIFNTEYAPIEEIEGVKKCLDDAGIAFHEIQNSKIWLGGGALYVTDRKDHGRAREVIEQFQEEWRKRAKENSVPSTINWKLVSPLLFILLLFILVTIQSLFG